jgi:modulator of FtsH protease
MHAFDPHAWHDFGVGVATAAASLTGLLFISLSINLEHILGNPWLPRRAGLTLILMFEALVLGLVLLTPLGSRTSFGWALIVVAAIGWVAAGVMFVFRPPPLERRSVVLFNGILVEVVTLGVLGSAISVAVGAGGGLYWLVPCLIVLLGSGIVNAWILLVEIVR